MHDVINTSGAVREADDVMEVVSDTVMLTDVTCDNSQQLQVDSVWPNPTQSREIEHGTHLKGLSASKY